MNSYDKMLRIVVVFVVFIACLGFVVMVNITQKQESMKQQEEADIDYFKHFTLYGPDGAAFTQEDLRKNKVTVINCWAPWCGPCVGEMPDLEKLNNAYRNKGIQMVGVVADYYQKLQINGDDYAEEYNLQIQEAVAATGVTYPILLADEAFANQVDSLIAGYPATFAVNADGELIEVIAGSQQEIRWRECFERWLEATK